jgi:DNA-binding NtrC family response regulator
MQAPAVQPVHAEPQAESASAPARGSAATAEPEPARHNGVPLDQPLRDARDQFERVYFEYHLAREGFSMTRVADRAGLERTHLYRKLKQLGIELARGNRRGERVEEPADVPPVVEARDAANEPRVHVQRDDYDD